MKLLLVAPLLLGCSGQVDQAPADGCSHEWSLCAARSDSQVTLWSNGATVTASCTFESSGVGSTYACSWPER